MQPSLRIIARPSLDISAVTEFLSEHATEWRRSADATPSEELIEFAGRVCYMSFGGRQSPRSNSEYIYNLTDQGHFSVLEHASWSFILSGVSRSFSHQLVRHRIGFSFSQLSQQYVDQRDIGFVEPFDAERYPDAARLWRRAVESLRTEYQRLQQLLSDDTRMGDMESRKEWARFVRSAARSLLPNATETRIVFTANARALRHFLAVRGATEGDPEMRKVAVLLLRLMQPEAPSLFSEFHIETVSDGSLAVKYRGHSTAE
jgi:thymidylate synthase (FAD)